MYLIVDTAVEETEWNSWDRYQAVYGRLFASGITNLMALGGALVSKRSLVNPVEKAEPDSHSVRLGWLVICGGVILGLPAIGTHVIASGVVFIWLPLLSYVSAFAAIIPL